MICKITAQFKSGNKIVGYEVLTSEGKRVRLSKEDVVQLIKNNQVLNARLQIYKGNNIIRLKENIMLSDVSKLQVSGTGNHIVTASNKTSDSNAKISDVLSTIKYEMKKASRYTMEQRDDEQGTIAFRHWGRWEITEEDKFDIARDEECDIEDLEESGYFEDYDHETLCRDWCKMLSSIEKAVRDKYPMYRIYATTSEKNWIDWHVESKK